MEKGLAEKKFLFMTCFFALTATSSAFVIRVMLMDEWQIAFGLSETQKGEIFGAGLWPFGLTIIIFSLIIDKIGYRRSLFFAFFCHATSAILMITATGYWSLYVGSILNGLAAGTVEACINPTVASLYTKSKTKMLTFLHAGWPAGMVFLGLTVLAMQALDFGWKVNVGCILLPTLIYGAMLIKAKFPISERVAAGVSYKDMLREAGAIGWLIVVYFICMEVNRILGLGSLLDTRFLDLPSLPMTIVLIVLAGGYFLYTRSLGKGMYILLLMVMVILAITELGTDSWIAELMAPAMSKIGLDAGWVLIYTASLVTALRFCVGPIVKALSPLGVLLVGSILAAFGLYFLSSAEGISILFWATILATGKAFFWPVTLGLASEQFPRGGALTLNAMAGVGMLAAGILGSQVLGYLQDINIDESLKGNESEYTYLMSEEELASSFGNYRSLNTQRVNEVNDKVALFSFRENIVKEYKLGEISYTEVDTFLASSQDHAGQYQTFKTYVRNAYDHHLGASGEKSISEMLAGLNEKGILVGAAAATEAKHLQSVLGSATGNAKRLALKAVTILPIIMAFCYLGFVLSFRFVRGGYTVVDINEDGDVTGSHKPTTSETMVHATNTPNE